MYDYTGRRVRKDVFVYDGAWPADDNPDERWHFVYDGWNVVMMLDGLNSNATTRKYTWGLDLSQTIHGAGGIGGLLAAVETQGTTGEEDDQRYWFFYDANGNVGQVLDATNTNNITIAATYEYDPYGNVLNSTGPYAATNPIRFSTKWFDVETGFYHYGRRYYDPKRGRWTSEDPSQERGGLNLYAAMANSPVYWFDPDGAEPTTQPAPTTQPSINNLDPTTYLGGLIARAKKHETTCGIYVVRRTFSSAGWPGHTFIMWNTGSVGFTSGMPGSDQQGVSLTNVARKPVSVYAVDYEPSIVIPGTPHPEPHNPYSVADQTGGLAYAVGPKAGTCCPAKPDCASIIACLVAQSGVPDPNFVKNDILTTSNCNSFARCALERCCLGRGSLIVNGYTGAYQGRLGGIVPYYDTENDNLKGWSRGPSCYKRCGCAPRPLWYRLPS